MILECGAGTAPLLRDVFHQRHTTVRCVWLNLRTQNPACREASHKVTCGRGGVSVCTPNPCLVQGSAI